MNKEDLKIMFLIANNISEKSNRPLTEITVKETLEEYDKQCKEYYEDIIADTAIEEEKAFPSDWCDADIY